MLVGATETDTKPGPGLEIVAVVIMTGVAVTSPIKIGIGGNVARGRLGSWVGIFTIVGDADRIGVKVAVGVSINVYVMKMVEVG